MYRLKLTQNQHQKQMKQKLVYIGTRLDSSYVKRYLYRPITEKALLENSVQFKSKLHGYETVGTVVEAHVSGNTYNQIELSDFKITEDHPAYENITFWSIEDRKAINDKRQITEASKTHPQNIESLITQIRDHSFNMTSKQRAAFALYVYNRLT